MSYSVIIPAYNEEDSVRDVVALCHKTLGALGVEYEIILVDDGSTDQTNTISRGLDVTLLTHPYNMGYGSSLKTGIRHARHDWIVITDCDSTYPVEELSALFAHVPTFDMVVGARRGAAYRESFVKSIARWCFKSLSEFVTGTPIPDINSGLRVFRKDEALKHFDRISGGFSFTTTVTLAFLMEGRRVKYVPIDYRTRIGRSHVRYVRDTLRSLQIIFDAVIYYNPVKGFLLFAFLSLVQGLACAILALLFPALGRVLAILAIGLAGSNICLCLGFLANGIRLYLKELTRPTPPPPLS